MIPTTSSSYPGDSYDFLGKEVQRLSNGEGQRGGVMERDKGEG